MKVINGLSNVPNADVDRIAKSLQTAVDMAIRPLLSASDRRQLGSAPAVYVERTHTDMWTLRSNLPDRVEELESVAMACVISVIESL